MDVLTLRIGSAYCGDVPGAALLALTPVTAPLLPPLIWSCSLKVFDNTSSTPAAVADLALLFMSADTESDCFLLSEEWKLFCVSAAPDAP
jgi:hypothetical protein